VAEGRADRGFDPMSVRPLSRLHKPVMRTYHHDLSVWLIDRRRINQAFHWQSPV